MSIWKTLHCLVLHWTRHTTYSNGARKCHRCGTYLRGGAAPKRWRKIA
jgi:hypothetical protein